LPQVTRPRAPLPRAKRKYVPPVVEIEGHDDNEVLRIEVLGYGPRSPARGAGNLKKLRRGLRRSC
jgi:hypothetical protein